MIDARSTDVRVMEGCDSLVPEGIAEMIQRHEDLQEEVFRLRREKAELARRLVEVETGSRMERQTRRAALNLMEDAVKARSGEQRENVERRKAEEGLREADRRKDEFLATLAHELRNPLAPIRNSIQILRLTTPAGSPAEPVHAMLERQVSHMVRLVDDLMEVSRITRGQIELRKELLSLSDVLDSAVEISRPHLEKAHHSLTISLPDAPIMLTADPVRLSQVFANLLINAAKYMDDGGKIWLTASQTEDSVTVSVRDNGIGIPEEMLSKIFNLFTQVDKALGRSQGGLGIGLTLVDELIRSHGGTIHALSGGLGHGSEFVVCLPLATN